jgi:hypothetical protein
MTQLQTALENTDLPELLMGTVDVIILLTEIYPSTFTKHFRVKCFNNLTVRGLCRARYYTQKLSEVCYVVIIGYMRLFFYRNLYCDRSYY